MKKIVYQGTEGSFSFMAGKEFFGDKNEFIGANSFKEIFLKVIESRADFGIIPVENTIAGSIYENLDLLSQYHRKIKIVGEIYLKIKHFLLGVKGNLPKNKRIKIIKKVYSHPKALEQCSKFFNKYPWIEKIAFSDTAGSAKFVSESKDLTLGAIASKESAEIYNLEIIKANIEDNNKNLTRFLIITRKENNIKFGKPTKSSLIFNLHHKSGTLVSALEVFKKYNINLTKIESRPIIGNPFEYNFFLDFEFNKKLDKIKKILEELKKHTTKLIILGFYPKGKWKL